VLGAIVGGWYLHRRLGAFLPLATPLRVGLAAGAAIVVGRLLPLASSLASLVEAGVIGVVFLIGLIATGELGKAELGAVTRVLNRRRGAP
jgi:stage V sporulation protein B